MHLTLLPISRRGSNTPSGRAPARSSGAGTSVVISVAAGLPQTVSGAPVQQHFRAAIGELHALLDDLYLPATWGVTDLFSSPVVDQVASPSRPSPPHEVGLQLDSMWSTPLPRRSILAVALARCTKQAKCVDLTIRTLFGSESFLRGNYDLLVKHEISGVRAPAATPSRWGSPPVTPRQLRYGLWEFPVSHMLSGSRSLTPGALYRLVASSERTMAAQRERAVHLGIDLAQLMAGDRGAWRGLDRRLRLLVRLRAEADVRIETLRALTVRLAAVPAAAPQRSILRRAA
jgi:hypothetical protein